MFGILKIYIHNLLVQQLVSNMAYYVNNIFTNPHPCPNTDVNHLKESSIYNLTAKGDQPINHVIQMIYARPMYNVIL